MTIIQPCKFMFLIILLALLSCTANEVFFENARSEDAFRAAVERGGLNDYGVEDASMVGYEHWIRSAYFIKTNKAQTVSIPIESQSLCYIFQYDINHRLIASSRLRGEVTLLKGCAYLRFTIQSQNIPDFVPLLFDNSKENPIEEKKVQMRIPSDRLVFAIDNGIYTTALLMLPPNYTLDGDSVPLIIWDSGDGSFSGWDSHEMGAEGAPGRVTGLSYLCDSGFAVLEIYSWGSYYFNKYPGCGRRSAMPIPTHLTTHEKGVEYVLDRYNIDPDNIFHFSKSGSGKIALYYAMYKPSFNLKAIYAFAPVFDDLNFVGWGMEDYRKALFEELELNGTKEEIEFFLEGEPYDYDVEYASRNRINMPLKRSWQMHKPLGRSFIENNAEKFKYVSVDWLGLEGTTLNDCIYYTHKYSEEFWEGYSRHYNQDTGSFFFSWDDRSLPAAKSDTYTRYDLTRTWSGIPLTVIMSPTDEQTPYWNALEVVKQFQNGGADVNMVVLETGGHSGPDLSVSGTNSISDITTMLGIHYDVVSIGWYLSVEDIYNKYLGPNELIQ